MTRLRLNRSHLPAVLLLAVLLQACAPDSPALAEKGREIRSGVGNGVLILVIDALRSDHTTMGGYGRNTTPRLAALGESEGTIFTNAWAAAPDMLPSHVSLLTGPPRRPEAARRAK